MDVARCTLDGLEYRAAAFARLPPAELGRKRMALECRECGGPAFFRKASRSGQAACFGARPHQPNCTLAATDYEQNDSGLGDDQDALKNPGERIILDLNFGAGNESHNNPDEPSTPGGRGGRFSGSETRADAVMHRRLSTILSHLVVSEQFRTSLQTIEVPGVGEFPVATFFVAFADVTAAHVGQYHGYWGMVTSARRGKTGALWLNSGSPDDVSICVPEEQIAGLFARSRVDKEADLINAHALVLGSLRTSRAAGKKHVQVDDLACISLRN